MGRKGISPLIAAVLLIAFTMAVASLFGQWVSQPLKDIQDDAENRSGELQRCAGIVVEIIDGNASHATIQQTNGQEAIGNMSVTWFYADDGPAQTYAEITDNRGVLRTNGGTASSTLDEIKVNAVNCEGVPEEIFES